MTNIAGEGVKEEAGAHNASSNQTPPNPPAPPDEQGTPNPGTPGNGPKAKKPERDSLDIANFVVLVLAFCAAAVAAVEADRLARDTEVAMSDARFAAYQTHTTEITREASDADAAGIQQRETEQALRIAKDQTDAAKISAGKQYAALQSQIDVLKGQRGDSIEQNRADIVRTDFIVSDATDLGNIQTGWIVTPKFRNLGETKAINVKVVWAFTYIDPPADAQEVQRNIQLLKPYCPNPGERSPAFNVGRNSDFLLGGELVTTNDANQLAAGSKYMIVTATVEWDDIFNTSRSHHSETDCTWYVPNNLVQKAWSPLTVYQNSN